LKNLNTEEPEEIPDESELALGQVDSIRRRSRYANSVRTANDARTSSSELQAGVRDPVVSAGTDVRSENGSDDNSGTSVYYMHKFNCQGA